MSHNIGVINNNIITDSFGKTTENSTPTNKTEKKKTSELDQVNTTSIISSEKRGEGNVWTIDLVKKYVNEYKLNVIPTRPKEKSPESTWTHYQKRFLTEQEIIYKFKDIDNENIRIGIICGEISGGLEVIDFDNKFGNIAETYDEFLSLPKVRTIVNKCPVEESQSGGFHIFYRSEEISGNKKLAVWPNGKNDKGNDKYETIIETRGEGGFCVCSPSKGYKLIQGSFSNIPVLSKEEREILLEAAASFNKKFDSGKTKFRNNKRYEESPWVEYDQSEIGLTECKDLLKNNGWTIQSIKGEVEYWCRPGKTEGVSASFKGNTFYVFSTNAYPFDERRYYFPSQIYATLQYGTDPDDFKKAIKDFVKKGFGKPLSSSGSKIEIEEVEDFLNQGYDFRLNDVTSKLELRSINEEKYKEADDYDLSSIYRSLQHKGIKYGYDKLNNLLNSDYVTRYDPFKEYFESLPKWDGTDYIKELADTVQLRNTTLSDYWYNSLRKFLIAMTACATVPEITNETSIILYGQQGEGKTKWLNKLVPDRLNPRQYLFVGNIDNDKDSKMNLATRLLINLDELGSINREEIGYLKSLYTLDNFSLREPYMRKTKNYIRRASFVGSIDREEFLTDLSGTRRFLTFAITEVDYEHNVDMDKVFGQAYSLFKQGERFYFNKEEIKEINKNNEEFRLKSLEEELLQMYFVKPEYVSSADVLTTTEIAKILAENNLSFRISSASIKKIGESLTKIGYVKKSVKRNGSSLKRWLVKRTDPIVKQGILSALNDIEQN